MTPTRNFYCLLVLALGFSSLASAEEESAPALANLDQLEGYGLTQWGERLDSVEKKTGKLTPGDKEGTFYKDTTLLGRPMRNHYTFFNGELVEVSLTLNDPQIQMETYPDYYMQLSAFLKDHLGEPTKEKNRLLEYSVMAMPEQVEKGYAKWFTLWSGKKTTVVLGMTPLEQTKQLVLYVTYLPTQPLASWPNAEAGVEGKEVPSAAVKPGAKPAPESGK